MKCTVTLLGQQIMSRLTDGVCCGVWHAHFEIGHHEFASICRGHHRHLARPRHLVHCQMTNQNIVTEFQNESLLPQSHVVHITTTATIE